MGTNTQTQMSQNIERTTRYHPIIQTQGRICMMRKTNSMISIKEEGNFTCCDQKVSSKEGDSAWTLTTVFRNWLAWHRLTHRTIYTSFMSCAHP